MVIAIVRGDARGRPVGGQGKRQEQTYPDSDVEDHAGPAVALLVRGARFLKEGANEFRDDADRVSDPEECRRQCVHPSRLSPDPDDEQAAELTGRLRWSTQQGDAGHDRFK
jgi:hypothetical protein